MLAVTLNADLLFKGALNGLIIAVAAMGIVLVYRSSRVINFAVGDLGVPATALLAVMAGVRGWPYWPSLIGALAIGAASGAVVEVAVIRRLSKAPRVIVLVATIGVAQFAQAVTTTIPSYKSGQLGTTSFPSPISGEWELPLGISMSGPQLFVLITVPLVALALGWLIGRTVFGQSVQATATNLDLARMTGISPKLVATGVWTVAGVLSALGIILTATTTPGANIVQIGPDTLLKALVAALIGAMVSFPRAALGAIAVGVTEQFFRQNVEIQDPGRAGLTKFVLFLVVLALVARVSRRSEVGGESFQFAPRIRPIPERLRSVWWAHGFTRIAAWFAFVLAVLAPLVITEANRHQAWQLVIGFALCAVSVTVLTGWGGQLSLGQMAFAGLSALVAASFARGLRMDLSLFGLDLGRVALKPAPFWAAALIGAAVATLVAGIVGLSALRVRGLLLGVSTLAFAIACSTYLYRRPLLSPNLSVTVPLPRQAIGPLDIAYRQRAYYYLCLGVLVVILVVVGHLRRTGIGRSVIGVRENESGAAAMTVSPMRAKLTAFMLGGFVAGIGGVLLAGSDNGIAYTVKYFTVTDSLRIIAIAVIGGLGSLAGAVVGSIWVIGLPLFFPDNKTVPLFVSSIGLLIVLLYLPGGFTQIGYWLRDMVLSWADKRLPPQETKRSAEPPAALARVEARPITPNDDGSVLATRALTVRFGGNVAVDGVDFTLAPNEVVGLIGTNGAGKSTLLNAIGGYLPASGEVHLLGRDVSGLRAHRRAQFGLGRTFQAATLFPELTVRETVELALEARHRTPFWSSTLFLPPALKLERNRRREADSLIDFLGLGRYADRFVAELSTGTRRIVELASVLAVGPRVICLDEPTAGVAQREAEAFGPLIKRIQAELGASLVIVEHDLPLIMSISDRVYCLEAGGVIASGDPETVRNDPAVVASYLGTDQRAIERSDSTRA